jgi:hypothetical protein
MTVVNIPNDHHFIGYIAIAIHGHSQTMICRQNVKVLFLVILRDKGHKRLPTPPLG